MTGSTVEGWAHYHRAGAGRSGRRRRRPPLRADAGPRGAAAALPLSLRLRSACRGLERGAGNRLLRARGLRDAGDHGRGDSGILGPNYYVYTLGKHQILALREKLRAREGAEFNLRAFRQSAFMQLPYPVSTRSNGSCSGVPPDGSRVGAG
jgi:hypothetical protein